jgi:hypothetical protein
MILTNEQYRQKFFNFSTERLSFREPRKNVR